MRYDKEVDAACPYCGKVKKVLFAEIYTESQEHTKTYCASCDRYFFVSARLAPVVEITGIASTQVFRL